MEQLLTFLELRCLLKSDQSLLLGARALYFYSIFKQGVTRNLYLLLHSIAIQGSYTW